jgi:general secretion pathway protein G
MLSAMIKRGFTLIELLVVLAIVATLLTLAVPRYFQHVERSKEAVLRENLATVRDAIDQYHADVGTWPPTLESLAEKRYLRAVPTDPITERSDTWRIVPPPDEESGIYDIHSGAEGTAANGQAYADW